MTAFVLGACVLLVFIFARERKIRVLNSQLRESRVGISQFHGILSNLPPLVAIAITDRNMNYIADFAAWRRLYGLHHESVAGLNHYKVFPGLPIKWRAEHQGVIQNGRSYEEQEGNWFTRPDGRRECISYGVCPWYRCDGSIGGVVMVSCVVTAIAQLREQIESIASYDPLTSLFNRHHGMKSMQLMLSNLTPQNIQSAVLFVDLNGFKAVNDRIGHKAGDIVLRAVSQRWKALINPPTVICRHGGDEFLVMLPYANVDTAYELSQTLIGALKEPIELDNQSVTIGASIGITLSSVAESQQLSLEQLINFSDIAMFIAKRDSPNISSVRFFDSVMLSRWTKENRIMRDLEGAIASGQFEMYYQPIINLTTGEVESFEALARWNHPQFGIVMPGDFLPAIEKLGLHEQLCEWGLETAIRQVCEWKQVNSSIRISCNVEPSEIKSGFALNAIAQLFDKFKQEGGLKLEIVERALSALNSPGNTPRDLEFCLSSSLGFLVDDFGSDESNFFIVSELASRTKLLELKLDRQALYIGEQYRTEALQSIVYFASTLDIPVTAEGVETIEQLEMLKTLGFNYAQGYLISQPVPADEAAKFLAYQSVHCPLSS